MDPMVDLIFLNFESDFFQQFDLISKLLIK